MVGESSVARRDSGETAGEVAMRQREGPTVGVPEVAVGDVHKGKATREERESVGIGTAVGIPYRVSTITIIGAVELEAHVMITNPKEH
jgi:hypothetical protein